MALYTVAIRKAFVDSIIGQGEWVNTYHVNSSDEEGALDVAEGIVALEKAIHWNDVTFVSMYARQASTLAGSGRTRQLTGNGERDATGESFLPSFNTVRVTLTDGIGRPDQKYLRPRINENEQNGGTLETSLVTLITTEYVTPLLALPGVVSGDGSTYTSGAIWPFVQMRQRSWSRRSRPGFKRGYVPV